MEDNKQNVNPAESTDKPNSTPEIKPDKKTKGNIFTNSARKIGNGINWCVDKVSSHPRTAIVVLGSIGTVAGYFLKMVVDVIRVTGDDDVEEPIETEFTDSEDDTSETTEDKPTEE